VPIRGRHGGGTIAAIFFTLPRQVGKLGSYAGLESKLTSDYFGGSMRAKGMTRE
jgi:hypothetical protein